MYAPWSIGVIIKYEKYRVIICWNIIMNICDNVMVGELICSDFHYPVRLFGLVVAPSRNFALIAAVISEPKIDMQCNDIFLVITRIAIPREYDN